MTKKATKQAKQVAAVATTTTLAAAQGQKKALRGFQCVDPARQREIASMGGRAAHASGNTHEFTSEEARAAARKGHEKRWGKTVPTAEA